MLEFPNYSGSVVEKRRKRKTITKRYAFQEHTKNTNKKLQQKYFLSHINIPKFSEDKAKLCEEDLTKKVNKIKNIQVTVI